jgi:quercetin dioxygenase-like cupin family protein
MVLVGNSNSVTPRVYHDGEKVRHVEKRVLVGPGDNAPNFSMRKFTVGTGGCSPYHTHPWEHEVYVLAGQGEVRFAGGSQAVTLGDFVFVPSNDEHQFVNTGDELFEFLCMVPLDGENG